MFKLLLPILIGLGITQFSMVSDILVWDRYLIEHGELWRIVTGNFTHTNLAHLIMNAAALVLFSYIFKELLTLKKLSILLFSISLLTGLALLFTPIQAYVGLSGVLHGLFVWAAIEDIKNKRQTGWLLLLGVIAKISWEHYFGASASTISLINAKVATEAHLFGAIAGGLLQIPALFLKTNKASDGLK
ncbi:rhombosortase [Aliivibrio fischeri]|uniref:rhombosortase n=1 Tax=Aliivibrio fischeri TaxID=668 RepID=UPI0016647074|nr:rhombosortase [Aliivibrio fischeri]USR94660.1 rhombosortase [Aliivibrio fischeri ATCC 7744 = JCM 18803 = DSM 507]GGK28505.1 rhombosortase [Aliivibrio fischeri]